MLNHYTHIYLAPHLDDVVLSCGGQIAQYTQAGEPVLIVSITAGDPALDHLPPFAQAHHDSWQLAANAVEGRRNEDSAACESLGADWLHLAVHDAIYRRHPVTDEAFYNNDDQLFGPINSAEVTLITTIAAQLRQLPTADHIICPLTVGNHVDHQLTRLAAETAFTIPLSYYEDYPYAHRHGLGNTVATGWQGKIVPISAVALQKKLAAIALYKSQVDHLFANSADMLAQVTAYTQQINGEKIWRKVQIL